MSDLIRREAVLDALKAIPDHNDGMVFETLSHALRDIELLPSAQPDLQEYSVWFRIGEILVDVSKMHITAEDGIEKIRSYLVRMKKPEREKGKWIYGEDEYGIDGYRCDKCGFFVLWDYGHNFINYIGNYNFCPSCGADMRGEENDT